MLDDLLVLEEATFAANAEVLAELVPSIERLLTRVVDPKLLLRDQEWRRKLTRRLEAVAAGCRENAASLFEGSYLLAAEAILDELTWCERTLAARYRGVAAGGVSMALDALGDAMPRQLDVWDEAVPTVLANVLTAVDRQTGFVVSRGEDSGLLAKRLLMPDKVNLPGCSGRGVLWGMVSGLNAASRFGSIRLANDCRTTSMRGMNEAADGR